MSLQHTWYLCPSHAGRHPFRTGFGGFQSTFALHCGVLRVTASRLTANGLSQAQEQGFALLRMSAGVLAFELCLALGGVWWGLS